MRKKEIQVINVLFCFFVILIHLLSEPVSQLDTGSLPWGAVFTLQRPLFCAVSGFLFLSALKTSLPGVQNSFQKVLRRLRRIWIPYLAAVLCYYLFEWCTTNKPFDLWELLIRILTGRQAAHFYFIIVITQFYLLHTFILKTVRKYPRACLLLSLMLSLATSFCWQASLYNLVITRYLFCYVLGCLAGMHYEAFCSLVKKHSHLLVPLYSVTALIDLAVALLHACGQIPTLVQQCVSNLCLPIAILFWYRIALLFAKSHPVLERIDRRTFPLYLWHILFILFSQWLCQVLQVPSLSLRFLITVAITAAGAAMIVIIPSFQKRLSR